MMWAQCLYNIQGVQGVFNFRLFNKIIGRTMVVGLKLKNKQLTKKYTNRRIVSLVTFAFSTFVYINSNTCNAAQNGYFPNSFNDNYAAINGMGINGIGSAFAYPMPPYAGPSHPPYGYNLSKDEIRAPSMGNSLIVTGAGLIAGGFSAYCSYQVAYALTEAAVNVADGLVFGSYRLFKSISTAISGVLNNFADDVVVVSSSCFSLIQLLLRSVTATSCIIVDGVGNVADTATKMSNRTTKTLEKAMNNTFSLCVKAAESSADAIDAAGKGLKAASKTVSMGLDSADSLLQSTAGALATSMDVANSFTNTASQAAILTLRSAGELSGNVRDLGVSSLGSADLMSSNATSYAKNMLDNSLDVANSAKDAILGISKGIVDISDGFTETTKLGLDNTFGVVDQTIGGGSAICDGASSLSDKLTSDAVGIVGVAGQGVNNSTNNIKDALESIKNFVQTTVNTTENGIKNTNTSFNNLKGGLLTGVQNAQNLAPQISDGFSSMVGSTTKLAEQVIGITSDLTGVIQDDLNLLKNSSLSAIGYAENLASGVTQDALTVGQKAIPFLEVGLAGAKSVGRNVLSVAETVKRESIAQIGNAENLVSSAMGNLGTIKDSVVSLNQGTKGTFDGIINQGGVFLQRADRFSDNLVGNASSVIDAVKGNLQNSYNQSDGVIGKVINRGKDVAIGALNLADQFAKDGKNITDDLGIVFGALASNSLRLIDPITSFADNASSYANDVLDNARPLVDGIKAGAVQTINSTGGLSSNLSVTSAHLVSYADDVRKFSEPVVNNSLAALTGLANNAGTTTTAVVNNIVSTLSPPVESLSLNVVNTVGSVANNAIANAKAVVSQIPNVSTDAKTQVTNVITTVTSNAHNVADNIVTVADNTVDAILAGQDAIVKISNSVQSGMDASGSILSSVTNTAQQAISPIANVLTTVGNTVNSIAGTFGINLGANAGASLNPNSGNNDLDNSIVNGELGMTEYTDGQESISGTVVSLDSSTGISNVFATALASDENAFQPSDSIDPESNSRLRAYNESLTKI